jgi:type 1 glutamine amidotransferase
MSKALFLYGGWPGHRPYEVARWARGLLDELGFDVDEITDPHRLEDDLTAYDLIVLGWTQATTTEDLSDRAEQSLLRAVEQGTGVAGWHGMAASFRASLPYHLVIGGAFIEHPGGEGTRVPYEVRRTSDHPVMSGVEDFRVASEQYYMHVDPSNTVIAETTFSGEHFPWIDGLVMPVAWVRSWGEGRIFYTAVGHYLDDLTAEPTTRMVRQGMAWAARKDAEHV